MNKSADYRIAIALRDGKSLWLLAVIKCASKGDFYYFMPRDYMKGFPHASHHKDGRTHIRSSGFKHVPWSGQKPNASFEGVGDLMAEGIQPGALAKYRMPCVESDYTDVWKIPLETLNDAEQHTLLAQLLQPGQESSPRLRWGKNVAERIFEDTVPWIRVTLWEGAPFVRD